MKDDLVFGITGASGSLGQMLTKYFTELGIPTVELYRTADDNSWNDSIGDLISRPEKRKLLVHSANPKAPRSKKVTKQFIENSEELIHKSSENNIQFLYISTMSIHKWNHSDYAKYKSEFEKKVLSEGGSSIRLGLLESNDPQSTYQRLFKLIQKNFVLRSALHLSKSVFYTTDEPTIKNFVSKLASNPILENKIYFLDTGNPFVIQIADNHQKYIKKEISVQEAKSPTPYIFNFGLKFLSYLHLGPADSFVNLCAGQKKL